MGVEVDGWWEKATKNPEVMQVRFFTQTTSCDEETYKEVELYFVTPRTCHLQTAIFFFKYLKIVKNVKIDIFRVDNVLRPTPNTSLRILSCAFSLRRS